VVLEPVHVEFSRYGYHSLQIAHESRLLLSIPSSNIFIIFCFHSHFCPSCIKDNILIYCSTAPLATVRLHESKGRHFSEFTILDFLPSTTEAPADILHDSAHLVLGNFFEVYSSRSALFC
jgi:hypothetical protein